MSLTVSDSGPPPHENHGDGRLIGLLFTFFSSPLAQFLRSGSLCSFPRFIPEGFSGSTGTSSSREPQSFLQGPVFVLDSQWQLAHPGLLRREP